MAFLLYLFIAAWILASLILVPIAARRRREEDPAIWIFAALLFSPLLVLLAFAAMPAPGPRSDA